jgi:hypothetical protein
MLDLDAERAVMGIGRAGDGFRTETIFDALLWRRIVTRACCAIIAGS